MIQLAKLSGYSPIIATASSVHEIYLKSLGATQVLPRTASLEQLAAFGPVHTVFDAVANDPAILTVAVGLISSPGLIITVDPRFQKQDSSKDITWVTLPNHAHKAEVFLHVQDLLGKEIVSNRVEVLPGGLSAIEGGLDRLAAGKVSGVKLVVNP